jgi:dTDP-L-rhamnose 4-epimerase
MARALAQRLGKSIEPEILQRYRVGDIRHCFAAIDKLETRFGLKPARRFEEGMDELIDWVARARAPVDRGESSMAELRAARLVV